MTTRLSGQNTCFLPFNKGDGTGAGNPDNPDGYKTAYLWEEVLADGIASWTSWRGSCICRSKRRSSAARSQAGDDDLSSLSPA